MFLAANLVFHARKKYIELDYHFVWKKLTAKQLTIHFISSNDQIADILAKSLARTQFQILCDKLTICINQLSLRGPVSSCEMENFSSKTV
jgi:macrodomain Ter protein organizer (MatP/YcbG family)